MTATKIAPKRGESTLYMRQVDPGVAAEANALATTREWVLGELVCQLLELRRGLIGIAAETAPVVSEPIKELLERLGLEPRTS